MAKEIFEYALESVKPCRFMKNRCALDGDVLNVDATSYDLSKYKNLYVFGSGKAAYSMAKEMEEILGDKIYKGLIVVPNRERQLEKIEMKKGSHPIPSMDSVDSAQALLSMMRECDEEDLYVYLLSGGSSALIEIPISPINLDDLQEATDLMLSENLEIQEINAVRKHISQLKGGRLAERCLASGIVLVLSDVIGDDLHAIGSAPLYADNSSFADAKELLKVKNLYSRMPKSVQTVLTLGSNNHIKESPSEPLERVSHHILASNADAKNAAREKASSLGLDVKIVQQSVSGEVSEALKFMFATVQTSKENCLIFGGECTLEVKGEGQGGRNQHAALLALKEIKDKNLNLTFLSAGTDGIDGNSDAAGGVVEYETLQRIKSLEMQSYLNNFDSYNFLKQIGALVTTGASGTNVIDLMIIIKGDVNV